MKSPVACAALAATLALAGHLPGGGATPIPVSCCDLDSMLPTCWGDHGQPVPGLAAPSEIVPGQVSPSRTVDQVPQRQLPNDNQDVAPFWPN